MTSQHGQQTIAIHILTNISRSKENQAIKFGQLIESSLRNIFLEKSYTKCGGETIPRPFTYLWINILKFYFIFIVWQIKDYRNRLKLSCRPLAFTSNKAF